MVSFYFPEHSFLTLSPIDGRPAKSKKVVISGCMHGNERIGLPILNWLATHLEPEEIHGEILLMLGNPKALSQNKRMTGTDDLNRLMAERVFSNIRKKHVVCRSYEENRALIIRQMVQGADLILDIHQAQLKAKSFIYCQPSDAHFKRARFFKLDYLVSPETASSMDTGLEDYANEIGGIGLTIEACGLETGDQYLVPVIEGILDCLAFEGVLSVSTAISYKNKLRQEVTFSLSLPESPKELSLFGELTSTTGKFKWIAPVQGFDFFTKGQSLGIDGADETIAQQNFYLIFPKSEKRIQKKGDVITYLAREKAD